MYSRQSIAVTCTACRVAWRPNDSDPGGCRCYMGPASAWLLYIPVLYMYWSIVISPTARPGAAFAGRRPWRFYRLFSPGRC